MYACIYVFILFISLLFFINIEFLQRTTYFKWMQINIVCLLKKYYYLVCICGNKDTCSMFWIKKIDNWKS